MRLGCSCLKDIEEVTLFMNMITSNFTGETWSVYLSYPFINKACIPFCYCRIVEIKYFI